MSLVPDSCDEVVDCLSLDLIHDSPKVVAQKVGTGVLKFQPGVENLRSETSFVVRRDVVLEDVSEVVEIALAMGRTVEIRNHLEDCNDGYGRYSYR